MSENLTHLRQVLIDKESSRTATCPCRSTSTAAAMFGPSPHRPKC